MDNKSQSILKYNCVNAGSELKNVQDRDRSRDTCLHQPTTAQGLLLRVLRAPQPDRSLCERKHTYIHPFELGNKQYTIQENRQIEYAQSMTYDIAFDMARKRRKKVSPWLKLYSKRITGRCITNHYVIQFHLVTLMSISHMH